MVCGGLLGYGELLLIVDIVESHRVVPRNRARILVGLNPVLGSFLPFFRDSSYPFFLWERFNHWFRLQIRIYGLL